MCARTWLLGMSLAVVATGAAAVPHEYWLPVVISKSGANGTQWRSELALVNASCSASATVQMFFYAGGAPQVVTRTLQPSEQLILPDVVANLFQSSEVSGPLRIQSTEPLVVSGRVFNQTPAGTLGQNMDGIEPSSALSAGAVAFLPALREDTSFRTNVQLLNMGSEAARVRLRFVAGTKEATRNVTIPPRSLLHLQQPLRQGLASSPNAWAEVEVVEGDGVWPFASVVDNTTGDATTMLPLPDPLPSLTGWLPVVARVPGAAGTTWRTSLALLNPHSQATDVRLRFRIEDSGSVRVETVRLDPGSQSVWEDLVKELFDLEGASGPLELAADLPIAAAARIYNRTAAGTYGQSVPVANLATALRVGETAILPFLRQGAFRSNLDFLNLGQREARGRLALFADGASAGSAPFAVPPGQRLRIDQVFVTVAGLPSVANGLAVVTLETGEALEVVGSVVDQTTGDPNTVVARPVDLTTPPTAAFTFEPSRLAAGATGRFLDQSTCFPHTWQWEFEGVTSYDVPRPQHTFASPGVKTVRLTTKNAVGPSAPVTRTITVEEGVTADFVFDPSPSAAGETVRFEDRSSGPVSEWRWEFGDGETSSVRNPTHIYAQPGRYPVSLRVSGSGASSTLTREVEVRAIVADFWFAPTSPRVSRPVQFVDRSLGRPTRWRWSFGDGAEADEANPVHTFTSGGPFSVTLTVGNELGDDAISKMVYFIPEISFDWDPVVPQAQQAVTFIGESNTPVDWWVWSLGDGSDRRWVQTTSHAFAEEGPFTVNLMAGNQGGVAWKGATLAVRGACAVPPAPELYPPLGAASSCPYYLRWSPSSPHQSYQLQESTDPGFSQNVRTFSVEGSNESPRLQASGGANTTLYYRVRARAGDYCGEQWSPWSAAAPVVVSPNQPCQVRVFTLPGGTEIEMVRIPAGTFVMGSPESEIGRLQDEQQHQVTISKDFYIGRQEVTQRQWREVVGSTPFRFPECGDDCPADSISWMAACGFRSSSCGEAGSFVGQLNRIFGLEASPMRFRLPTEAEWEYAARAGTTGPYSHPVTKHPTTQFPLLCDGQCGGCPELDAQAWWCANALDGTRPGARKVANPWGLYDVHGGLMEWVEDWYGPYPAAPVTDPIGASRGSYRVLRGGSWYTYARFVRAAARFGDLPGFGDFTFGFRLAFAEPLPSSSATATAPLTTEATPPSRSVPQGPPLPTGVQARR